MPNRPNSLLAGRNQTPLSDEDQRRVTNTFLGMDRTVSTRYEEGSRTVFHVVNDEITGEEYGEIRFGPDILPGRGIIDPNSALGMDAAAAHELTHFYRWRDRIELTDDSLEHLDEALTSLMAILRYRRNLNNTDVDQLVSDAIQRIQLYLSTLENLPAE